MIAGLVSYFILRNLKGKLEVKLIEKMSLHASYMIRHADREWINQNKLGDIFNRITEGIEQTAAFFSRDVLGMSCILWVCHIHFFISDESIRSNTKKESRVFYLCFPKNLDKCEIQ